MYFRRALVLTTAFSFGSAVFAAGQETGWKDLMLGAAENDAAKYKRAEGFLTKAVLAQPNNPVPLIQRGRCYWRLEKHALAAADFAAAVKLHPGPKLTIQAWKFRIAADQSMKNWRAVIADCNRVIQLNPNEPLAYSSRFKAYDTLGQHDLAQRDAAAWSRLAPRTQAYRQATNLIRGDGASQSKFTLALAFLDRHIKDHPGDGEAYFERAGIKSQLGKPEQARADYDAAVRLQPDRFNMSSERAGNLVSLKRYKEAIVGYSDALLLAPGNDHVMLDRASCYTRLGDYVNSIKDYTALIELHPDDGDPVLFRAQVYSLTKQYTKALSDYDRAIQLSPDQANNYSGRSKVYEKLGKHDLAVKDDQKASELLSGPIR